MNRKWLIMAIALFFTVAVISACGDDNNNNNNNNDDNNVENEENNNNDENENNENNDNDNNNNDREVNALNDDNDNNDNDNDNNDNETASADSDFDELIDYMEEETEGEADILYEDDSGDEHDMEGVTFSLDEYALVELNDFHNNFSIPFDDETDGGLVIAKYTVTNDSDDDVSYMPMVSGTYEGAEKNLDNYRDILPKEEQLAVMLSSDDDYELKAGEELTGYYTYPFGSKRMKDILSVGEMEVEIPQPQEDADDYSSTLGDEGTFTLSLDESSAGKNKTKEGKGFYEDKFTSDNWGDKEMLDKDEDIGETKPLRDVDVTLEGYQFTQLKPNSEQKARFESFEHGIVLLTVKYDMENNGDTEIGKNSVDSKVIMNDGAVSTISDGILLDYRNDDTIEPGDSGELLQVYLMDKRDYEDWEDRSFEAVIGPLRDAEAKDISKGNDVEFDLK